MNGAEALIRTAQAAGIEVCFANPGTTELPLVAALDSVPGMQSVLGLFEGVCSGAADGYGRITGKPALTLTHLGPGFANSLANVHNARRARTPMVNLIGDHATWHVAADAPLTSDIESLARPMSAWVRTSNSAPELPRDGAEAIAAASSAPGQVATLICPQDCQWGDAEPALPGRPREPGPAPADTVTAVARLLRDGEPAVLLLGSSGLSRRGLDAAARISSASGCRLLSETFVSLTERGLGIPAVERLPYFPAQALEALSGTTTLVLAGAIPPVSFFGYPDTPSSLVPQGTDVVELAVPGEDIEGGLEALAQELGGGPAVPPDRPVLEAPAGELSVGSLGRALAASLREGDIVVEEGNTSGAALTGLAAHAPPHRAFGLTGGAIGQGLPSAVGAAVGAPGCRVLALEADGSGMYTLQALWTMAREALDVTVVVASNRSYRILKVELAQAGMVEPGPAARALTDLDRPDLDWPLLSRGMGVPGVRVETADELVVALERARAEPGPSLVEAILP